MAGRLDLWVYLYSEGAWSVYLFQYNQIEYLDLTNHQSHLGFLTTLMEFNMLKYQEGRLVLN